MVAETEIIKIIDGLLSAELRRLQVAHDVKDSVPEAQADAELYDRVAEARRWVVQTTMELAETHSVLNKEGLLIMNGKLFLRKDPPISIYGDKTERIV